MAAAIGIGKEVEEDEEKAKEGKCEIVFGSFQNPGEENYRVTRNFSGSLFLRIGVFFLVLREIIFAIKTDWFFLLGINFCDFQKVSNIEIIEFSF